MLAQIGKVKAQELEEIETLRGAIKSFYNKQWSADRAQYLAESKGEFWAQLPQVGFAFGLPSINLGTKDIYNIKQAKREKAASLKSMDMKYRVLFNEELQKLTIEYRKIEIQIKRLEKLRVAAELEEKIFAIHAEAHGKRETSPIQFLNAKKAYLMVLENESIERAKVELQILELYKLAKYGLKDEPLYFEDQSHKMRE